MPRRLLDRCNPDSIHEFRAAARIRYDDGLVLAATGQRTGAVYVWGYAAEMTIKAEYFSFIGLKEKDKITWNGHLKPAIQSGQAMNIFWPNQGAGHNVRAWTELLILTRAQTGTSYPSKLSLEVQKRSQRIEHLWKETLRYHKNFAYQHEVRQVRESIEWFLVNSKNL